MESEKFRKILTVTAAAITLVEAEVWVGIAMYGIFVFNCIQDFQFLQNGISSWTMLYIAYFMGGCKSASEAATLGYQITPPTSPARNLQVWMWISAIGNSVWLLACGLLLVVVACKIRGKKRIMVYYFWLVLTALMVIIDLVATIFYFVDTFNSTTPDSYATFVGSSSWSTLTSNAATDGVTSWLPSLFMTLFFCRFLVFWVLNVVLTVLIYRVTQFLSVEEI